MVPCSVRTGRETPLSGSGDEDGQKGPDEDPEELPALSLDDLVGCR